jgi:predicted dienelactone hydrolase
MCGMVSLILPAGYRASLVLWILLTSSLLLLMVTTDNGRLAAQEPGQEYIPATSGLKVRVHQSKLRDSRRAKDLFVRVSSPEEKGVYPVIIWSHGMYGSKDNYQPLAEHWTRHGYVVIQPSHSDSISLMTSEEKRKILTNFNLDKTEDWINRPRDVQFIIDSLSLLASGIPELSGRMDLKRIGVGGHSFGAVTTQLIAGTTPRLPAAGGLLADARVKAFVAISPNGTGPFFSKDSLAQVAQPILFISGDNDKGRHGEQAIWRRAAFDDARAGEKYLVWIRGAHHNFGGISGAPPALSRLIGGRGGDHNEVQLQLVRVATLAFWDTCMKENKKAEAYLTGDGLIKFGRQELKVEHK